jgi:lipopolysaccharide transport system ATP-binding protein
MACVQMENVSLTFPLYGANARSLRVTLMNKATGGRLGTDNRHVMVEALKDVSFTLQPGDRLAVLGHNGAGKSTLLKVLAGIYEPTKGAVKVKGRVNCLFDIMMGMDQDLNAYENIALRGMILGLSKSEIKKITPQVEEFAELGEFVKMPIKSYSSGMKVRLAFGIITHVSSEILLIDEIVNVGDAKFIQKAKLQMTSLIHQAEIMVLSSHDIHITKEFCNKALLLEKGVLKYFGNLEEALQVFH